MEDVKRCRKIQKLKKHNSPWSNKDNHWSMASQLHQIRQYISANIWALTRTQAAYAFSLVFPSVMCVSSSFVITSSAETLTSSFGSISDGAICHILTVPSSDPEAYDSPPGANLTQWTGPWWPLLHPTIQMIYNVYKWHQVQGLKKATNFSLEIYRIQYGTKWW